MCNTLLLPLLFAGQPHFDGEFPRGIIATYTPIRPSIDGRIDDPAWATATWSEPFVEITGDERLRPKYETRIALVWDSTGLYVAARLEEGHVWATITERDAVIYHDNDFEFFFDPDGDRHRYGEIEINALNTVWDLLLERPYRNGGPARTGWNIEGLQTAVFVDGTLNDPKVSDRGWNVEMKLPWESIRELIPTAIPPPSGSQWRINFSRVQWITRISSNRYEKSGSEPLNWVWTPQGVVDMHRPEKWGVLEFRSDSEMTYDSPSDPLEKVRGWLMGAFESYEEFRKSHGRPPDSLEAISIWKRNAVSPEIRYANGERDCLFWVDLQGEHNGRYCVSSDGRLFLRIRERHE